MQAAFVDIGLSKDAFLYAGDYMANLGDYAREMLGGSEEDADVADVDLDEVEPKREARPPLEEILRKGQEVLVQVAKESLGTKGARVTSFVSLPGRYLVYMPHTRHIGVSRRIPDEHERDRLRALLRSLKPAPGGVLLRNHAEGRGQAAISRPTEVLWRPSVPDPARC